MTLRLFSQFAVLTLLALSTVDAVAKSAGRVNPVTISAVSAVARVYDLDCQEFERRQTDIQLYWRSRSVAWGSNVYLVYGLSGQVWRDRDGDGEHEWVKVEWQNPTEIEIPAVGSFRWKAKRTLELANSHKNYRYDKLDFVFRIEHSDGRVEFDTGSDAPWAFYRVVFRNESSCINGGETFPPFVDYPVEVVIRDNRGPHDEHASN